jgi:hypothetical protein
MEFSRKLPKQEKEEYISICEIVWGCVPIDVDWAIGTNIYKSAKLQYRIVNRVIKAANYINNKLIHG